MCRYRSFLLISTLLLVTACSNEEASIADHSGYFLNPKELCASLRHKKPLDNFQQNILGDGSYELEYEYNSPEDDIYVYQFITIENNPLEITSTYNAIKTGIKLGISSDGVETREVVTDFCWGEESSLREYEKDGKYLGLFFITRKDNKIYSILMKGVKPDNHEVWKTALLPRLEQLESSDIAGL
ncbi:MAG TPA: hypothetical protein VIK89_14500 [Cytophagaceae bacterium]